MWKTEIPGSGWSSPVVWGDRIFLTSVISTVAPEAPKKGLYFGGNREGIPTDEHRWMVYAVDWKTGKIVWEREVHRGVPASSHHLKNTYASETPVTDGERVYAYFGNLGLFVFDMEGKPVWSQPWGPFRTRYGWGTASSPVLYKDRIYVVNDNDDKSFLAVLDKRTGKQIWRVERDEASNWSTPYIWENDRRTEIITSGTRKIRSYDLDGKVLWELGGMSSIVDSHAVRATRPVVPGVGLRGRPGAAGVRGESRARRGDISLKEGETEQRVHRLVSAAGRAVQSVAAGLRRLLLHAARPRHLDLPRCAHGPRDLRQAAHRSGGLGVHGVALGVQRQDLRAERGWRHVRDPGRQRVQGAGQESAGRDVHGHARHRARKPDHSHGVEAVPDRPNAIALLQTKTRQRALVPHVEPSIRERGVGSHHRREQLGVRQRLELLGRCRCKHQLAVFAHEQQAIAGQRDRAGAEAIHVPLNLAGFQLDAAEALAVFLPAVIAVQISVAIDAGGVVAGECIVGGPELFRSGSVDLQKRSAGAVARREKDQVARHYRRGGIHRCVAARAPRELETDLAGFRVDVHQTSASEETARGARR